jgi:uncharacterized damage-inducible protein DinB
MITYMTAAEARIHLRYSGWASRKLVDAAGELSPEARIRPMGVSHESLQKTLGHIYAADQVWYSRTVDASVPLPAVGQEYTMDALTGDWVELQKKWEAWADSLIDGDLDRVAAYKLRDGSSGEAAVWQIVMHVVNHGTLHRGQVMAMIRQLGAKPPATDLIFYYREA